LTLRNKKYQHPKKEKRTFGPEEGNNVCCFFAGAPFAIPYLFTRWREEEIVKCHLKIHEITPKF